MTEYGYVYNTGIQTVAVDGDVTFSTNGVLSAGITHAPGGDAVTLLDAGTYKITYSVTAVALSQVALFVDGAEVPGTTYGSGAGTQQNTGQVIITVAAGAVLSAQEPLDGRRSLASVVRRRWQSRTTSTLRSSSRRSRSSPRRRDRETQERAAHALLRRLTFSSPQASS